MQTMMERIAEAEQKADRLLEDANQAARDRIASAKEEAAASVAAAQDYEREKTAEEKENAARRGETLAAEILAGIDGEIADVKKAGGEKIPEAVSYLLERIAKL